MKKTALVLGGLLSLSLVVNTFAQTTTNVYSKNAVGYVNLKLTNEFSLISVPLLKSSSGSLQIGDLLPTAPLYTILYFFNPTTQAYDEYTYYGGTDGWRDLLWNDVSTVAIPRGVGLWIGFVTDKTDLSIVGEVPGASVGTTTVLSLMDGFSLISYPYPVSRKLSETKLGQTPSLYDIVYLWDGAKYLEYTYYGTDGWRDGLYAPVDPVLDPGAGFWYFTFSGSKDVTETKPYDWP